MQSTNDAVGVRIPPSFEYAHTVLLEETNVVGNVYFARHIAWQGRCREMFLKLHAPSVAAELGGTLRLVTTSVECTYFDEIRAFDEILIRLSLVSHGPGRARLAFDYVRKDPSGVEQLVAHGEQQIACLRQAVNGNSEPQPFPPDLLAALERFSGN
ncbi:acyl-CoA thioesterase [Mesorhizobium sp. L-8-3]|uniref:acyl-CoA thioesterase n=1 Tax=Mesorhizobium sp. L-8-3 TaxID=2744522 RepID=UPI001925BF26|nr:acyl-CoA thioesterase [Mesorhizobium sp. L-8-3]BCH27807.1 4-hydroxybenzoyl-CoA thioesterase [Mesorhizobium sp. L-8-3]